MESQSKSGGFLIVVWLMLAAMKADGIIGWMWTTIVVGPVVALYMLSLVTALLAKVLSRSMMRRL